MTRLKLNYGGVRYLDRTRALETGEVSPVGIDLNYVVPASIGDLFRNMAMYCDYDVAEFSLSSLMIMMAKGDNRLIGLPVFPSRAFRHSQIYINAKAGIKTPKDLIGRVVGVSQWQMTAALWVRAHLQHDYGVRQEQIKWRTGGLFVPQFATRAPITMPDNIELKQIPEGETLENMLLEGSLDALVTTEPPKAFVEHRPEIQRLFADSQSVEREYYKRTGFFPIMHVVVMRRDVYEANKWIALPLLNAFNESKRLGIELLRYQGAYGAQLPWLPTAVEEVDTLFGGDAFPYGLQANAAILDAMIGYADEQGLLAKKVTPRDLFAPETWAGSIPG